MKIKASTSLYIISLCFLYLPSMIHAQDNSISSITEAIKQGSSSKLSNFFYSTIDLEVGDIDGSYSKKQAEIILQDFFKKDPVKSFEIKHQGSSNDGSQYIIGSYKTASKSYRVYMLLKKDDANLVIHQLQFEED